MDKYLFRYHKGGLDESLATTIEVADFDELRKMLAASLAEWNHELKYIELKHCGFDPRCNWDTYYVICDGHIQGMTNGNLGLSTIDEYWRDWFSLFPRAKYPDDLLVGDMTFGKKEPLIHEDDFILIKDIPIEIDQDEYPELYKIMERYGHIIPALKVSKENFISNNEYKYVYIKAK